MYSLDGLVPIPLEDLSIVVVGSSSSFIGVTNASTIV